MSEFDMRKLLARIKELEKINDKLLFVLYGEFSSIEDFEQAKKELAEELN